MRLRVAFGLFSVTFACVGDSSNPNDAGPDVTQSEASTDAAPDAPLACDAGSICSGSCVDTQTSAANCGSCGHACKSGASCLGGKCGDTVVEVAAGGSFQCAVRLDGAVVCWGQSDTYALGYDPQPNDPVCYAGHKCKGPAIAPALTGITHIALGDAFGCAIKTDQSVECWGDNGEGQLATAPSTFNHSSAPVAIPLPAKVTQISCSTQTACAVTVANDVYCWGNNNTGVTGKVPAAAAPNGGIVTSPFKVPFASSDVTAVVVSGDGTTPHACAIRNSDTVWCWGSNYNWELAEQFVSNTACAGDICETNPVKVPGLSGVVAISGGYGSSCALTGADGVAHCWGDYRFGQNATSSSTWVVNTESGLPNNKVNTLAGTTITTFAHAATGETWAWGMNGDGNQGDGTRDGSAGPYGPIRTAATAITNLSGTVMVRSGSGHGVALKSDGTVVGWGENDSDQAGHAPNTQGDVDCGGHACNPTPVTVVMP